MSPELARTLFPMQTPWRIAQVARASVAGFTMLGDFTSEYLKTLRLYWGGYQTRK